MKLWQNFVACEPQCEAEKLNWTVGDPAASLEIKGGNHAAFPTRNLNNDPETFWHSGTNKQIILC